MTIIHRPTNSTTKTSSKKIQKFVPKNRGPSEAEKLQIKQFLENRAAENRVININEKENEKEGMFHISDAEAYGSTGIVQGTQREASGLSTNNILKEEKKERKSGVFISNNVSFDLNTGYAYRVGNEDNCYIHFNGDRGSDTLTIQHFICKGSGQRGGILLLKNMLDVLKDEESYQFQKIELTAASLDPDKEDEDKTVEDLEAYYRLIGFHDMGNHKFEGNSNNIIVNIKAIDLGVLGGSKKTKRRQQSKKRRKSIKKNYLKRRRNTRRKSIRKRK